VGYREVRRLDPARPRRDGPHPPCRPATRAWCRIPQDARYTLFSTAVANRARGLRDVRYSLRTTTGSTTVS